MRLFFFSGELEILEHMQNMRTDKSERKKEPEGPARKVREICWVKIRKTSMAGIHTCTNNYGLSNTQMVPFETLARRLYRASCYLFVNMPEFQKPTVFVACDVII